MPEVSVRDGGFDIEKMMDGFTEFCLTNPKAISVAIVAILVAWFASKVVGNRFASGIALCLITAGVIWSVATK